MEDNTMPRDERHTATIPYGTLGIVPLKSCSKMGEKVDDYLVQWREQREHENQSNLAFSGYKRDSYVVSASTPRFGSGEGKGVLVDSVRGTTNHMSPDDHYADLKRVIAAAGGKARRINVIMPFLYESRQHKRSGRESLDCALMLQELTAMGVENIITFDAHDPRVHNSIPLKGFESVSCTYQFIKYLLLGVDDLHIDSEHMMVISPDEGGMGRAVYFANVLGLDMGMFYKRRDYTKIVNGRNPIVAHEFLGTNVEGKDVIIIDDMISSGESMIDVASELKKRGASRVFCATTFGLFTNGFDKFDEAYEKGIIDKILTTNLVYQPDELLSKPWYINVDMSKYMALLIDTLNHDSSISDLLNPVDRIQKRVKEYNERYTK